MTNKECPRFDGCNAPLCPLDTERQYRFWYPDEDICKLQAAATDWVRRQRRVAKKAIDTGLFFTIKMLSHNCRIRTGIKGLDPNAPESQRLKHEREWIKQHPKIVITEEMKNRGKELSRRKSQEKRQSVLQNA